MVNYERYGVWSIQTYESSSDLQTFHTDFPEFAKLFKIALWFAVSVDCERSLNTHNDANASTGKSEHLGIIISLAMSGVSVLVYQTSIQTERIKCCIAQKRELLLY